MSKIYYKEVKTYSDDNLSKAIKEYFEKSEASKRLSEKSRVLLKPNLLAKHTPNEAVTTHPAVVREVILALQRRGVKNIMIADSPGGIYRSDIMRGIYSAAGLTLLSEQTDTKLYTECKFFDTQSNGQICRSWNFIEPVRDCDFIINLPKIKTHMMMGMSCGIKNLFGCIPGLQKAELHMRFPEKEPFASMLCDLYEAIKPDMTIADGILSMEGNGPAGGSPRMTKIILACDSAALLDLSVCDIIGFEPKDVPYMNEAINRGLCPNSLKDDMFYSERPQRICDFKKPSSSSSLNFSGNLPKPLKVLTSHVQRIIAPHPQINKKACIGCAKCAEICPAQVITVESRKADIDNKRCIRCFCCHEVCPVKAINVKRSILFKL